MINNKISKQEYYNKLDKINLLDYMVDSQRNQNYFFYKGCKYVQESIIIKDKNDKNYPIKNNYYKFNK